MKIGFIGFGRFAQLRVAILSDLSDLCTVEVVGYYDPHASNDNTYRRFSDACYLIDSVDAVIVSVPPVYAPHYVAQCLKARKHVFCEKPAAISAGDLREVEPLLDDDLVLAYGFNHRQHPSVRRMKEIILNGSLGNVLWMRGRYGKEVDAGYKTTWRSNRQLNGGGILIDQGIHMLDLMVHLGGGFDGVQAVLSNSYLGIEEVEDNAFVTLFNSDSKVAASVHSTITQWRYLFSLEVFLEHGSMVLNGLRTSSGRYGDEVLTVKPVGRREKLQGTSEYRYPSNVSWTLEMEAFIHAVSKREPYPFSDYSDALCISELMDEIYERAVWI